MNLFRGFWLRIERLVMSHTSWQPEKNHLVSSGMPIDRNRSLNAGNSAESKQLRCGRRDSHPTAAEKTPTVQSKRSRATM